MNFQLLDGNNLKIRSVVEGEGPLVVLVHGWPESWYSWRHQIKPLTEAGFKVAAIDVRGYGGSDKPHDIAEYSLKNIAADIAGVIDSLGYKEAFLFGHDWGGPIVWTTGLLYQDTIKAVGALSVPYTPVGEKSLIQLFRELYKDKFFYQLYIQEEGVAEAEFEADVRKALEITYFSGDGRGMQFMLENIGNPAYQKTPDSKKILEINAEHPMIVKISENLGSFDHKKISQVILDQANILDGNVLSNPTGYMESLTELFIK